MAAAPREGRPPARLFSRLRAFAFDENDRLIGVVEVPSGTLQDEELRIYIEALAKECDRFEYVLQGWDRE